MSDLDGYSAMLDGYDEMFLDLLSLIKRVERTMGDEDELYEHLDAARVAMIECAPAGWSAADVLAEGETP